MQKVTATLETLCGCAHQIEVVYPPQPTLTVALVDHHKLHERPVGGYPPNVREFRNK